MAIPDLTPPRTATSAAPDAQVFYTRRLAVLRQQAAALQREHLRLGYLRLAFGVATVLMLFPPIPFILLGVLGFALAARIHGRVLGELAATRRAIAFYERGLGRLSGAVADAAAQRAVRLDLTASLYATDLDLFGPGSLFDRLCEARTTAGEDTLAAWLLQPAPVPEILARQVAVAELRDRASLREAFAAARGPALASLDLPALRTWAEDRSTPIPTFLRWIAPVLVLLTLAAGWRYAVTRSPVSMVGMLVLNASLTYPFQRRFKAIFANTGSAARALQAAVHLLKITEGQSFASPRLQQLHATLHAADVPASRALGRLARLAQWIDGRSNYILRILDIPLLYSLQLAGMVEAWRGHHGQHLIAYLEVLGEVEALLSLAGFQFEHPDYTVPEFVEGPPRFHAEALGHPLLRPDACIRNDVSLDAHTQALLVSGSNMSGKSTLMRAVGINTVLAQAGAPVCARRLQLCPLTVAASIQVQDSLMAGQSRFYAEILRLRAVAEAAAGPTPVLFLLDELLAGTNSADRFAGAAGLLQALLAEGALGMVSTHDLTLAELATGEDSRVHNVHFEDTVVEGRLEFDYTLREGTVTRSNGLALMRMIGLDV